MDTEIKAKEKMLKLLDEAIGGDFMERNIKELLEYLEYYYGDNKDDKIGQLEDGFAMYEWENALIDYGIRELIDEHFYFIDWYGDKIEDDSAEDIARLIASDIRKATIKALID